MATLKEIYNFECKVFEPTTSDLSQAQLKTMLKQLYQYFPYTQNADGSKEPYATDNEYSKKWFKSYEHLLMLIEMKKQETKHNISVWLSAIAIVVSVIGVATQL